MRLRKTYITNDETIEDSGTWVKNLDFKHPIRALLINFYGKRYDHTDTNPPYLLADIDKIEIVDGSDVIYSLTGKQAAAACLYHNKLKPFEALTLNSTSTNRTSLKICFGRDVSDDEFGLDLSKFLNPQIKISYSFAEGATGGWADGKQSLTVIAIVAEGAPMPRGFFMTKEVYSWSKASSGDETIPMPRDLPYRFVVMQALAATTPIYAEFTKAKISCNYDEFVPFDETVEDMAWENIQKYGMQYQQCEVIGDGSDTDIKAYLPFAWNWGAWLNSWNSGQSAMVKRPYSGYSTIGRHTCPDSSGADFTSTYLESSQRVLATGYGWEYYDTEVILFGDMDNAEDWFDPKPWKSVRLILTQAQNSGLTSSIVIQQVRIY